MKLLILTTGEKTASAVFRFVQHLPEWQRLGLDCTVFSLRGSFEKSHLCNLAQNHDVVLLQKKLVPLHILKLLLLANPRLVFEFDDVLWTRDSKRNHWLTVWRRKRLAFQHFQRAAAVSCTNHYLADFARPCAKEVHVIPLSLDTEMWKPRLETDESRFVVGWIGASVTQLYLRPLLPAMVRFQQQFSGVEWQICSETEPDLPGVTARFIAFEAAQETIEETLQNGKFGFGNGPGVVRGFDVGLCPLGNSEFARGKSSIKILQYMASGVVPLVSDVGSARELVEHGKNGFLIADDKAWGTYLLELMNNPQQRRAMAQCARKTILEGYSNPEKAQRFAQLLSSVAGVPLPPAGAVSE